MSRSWDRSQSWNWRRRPHLPVISDTIERLDALKAVDGWRNLMSGFVFMTRRPTYGFPGKEMVELRPHLPGGERAPMDEYRNEFQH